MSAIQVRSLTLRDTQRVLEIDASISKTPVKEGDNDLWRLIAETTTCFGATEGGKLIGFVLADIRPWEFGQRAHVGWIISLGVERAFQGKGVGKLLGERVIEQFERLGVTRAQTIVAPETAELEPFFKALGFAETRAKVLVRER